MAINGDGIYLILSGLLTKYVAACLGYGSVEPPHARTVLSYQRLHHLPGLANVLIFKVGGSSSQIRIISNMVLGLVMYIQLYVSGRRASAKNGESIYQIFSAVVPFYFAMLLGYGSVTWCRLLTPAQCAGINKLAVNLALPMIGFKAIANGVFYSMNLCFVGADTIPKVEVLMGLFAWFVFSWSGKMKWVITVFTTTTFSNTLVVGVPLLEAMYPGPTTPLLVQIFVLQIVIWTNVMMVMFEFKAASTVLKTQFHGDGQAVKSIQVDQDILSLGAPAQLEADTEVGEDGQLCIIVRRSFSRSVGSFSDRSLGSGAVITGPNRRPSALSGVEIFSLQSSSKKSTVYPSDIDDTSKFGSTKSLGEGWPAYEDTFDTNHSKLSSSETNHEHGIRNHGRPNLGLRMHVWPNLNEEMGTGEVHAMDIPHESEIREEIPHSRETSRIRDCNSNKPPAHVMAKLVTLMVWRKFRQNPNNYACVLGLAWSLLSVKLNFRMPLMMIGCVSIISNTGIGIVMYGTGLFIGLQPKIISCGKTALTLTMADKFIFGPLLVAVAGLALGLRGTLLNIAILQAALPLANAPLVFSQEYDVYPNLISSGLILGLLITIPVALVYNIILEKL